MKSKLTTFKVEGSAAELPQRLKVLNWGDNANTNRPLKVGTKTMTYAPALAKARGHEKIALDYQHNTVPGTPANKESTEPRKVAAYGRIELVQDEGAFFVVDAYTPSGKENAKEFADLSVAVEQDENGEVLFFHSVALCRQGSVEGIEFGTYEVDFESEAEEPKPEDKPEPKAEDKQDEMKAALATMTEQLNALSSKLTELEAKIASLPPAPPVETFTAQGTRLADLEARVAAGERAAGIDKLKTTTAAAGKIWIFSADDEAKLDLATMAAIVERSPRSVSTRRQTNIETFTSSPDAKAEDPVRVGKIRTRAAELRAANPSLSFPRAWEQASAEIPA